MSWDRSDNGFTFQTGRGIHLKDAIGPTENYGPNGQRYLIRFNVLGSFLGIEWVNGTGYNWARWNGRDFENIEPATEADWVQAWELGPYEEPTVYTPDQVAQANAPKPPNLSFLNNDSAKRISALIVAAIVLTFFIWKK